MNIPKVLIAIAGTSLVSLSAAGANDEEYQGMRRFGPLASRADVRAQAAHAAYSADSYAEGASAEAPVAVATLADRASIRADADAAAHAGNRYGDGALASVASRSAKGFARTTGRSGSAMHGVVPDFEARRNIL